MSMKVTRKSIVQNYNNIVCAGYCDLQSLLHNHKPICHTEGVYGWNFDMYYVYDVAICTGYRNMPGKRANGISKFETEAREIWDSKEYPYGCKGYEQRCDAVEELLKEFCKLNGGKA